MQLFFKKYFLPALIVSLLLAKPIAAQEKQAETFSFTLPQAVEYAFQNRSSVLNAAIDREIAHKKVSEITGSGFPQINGAFDVQKFLDIPTSFIPGEFFDEEAGTYIPVKFGQPYNASASLSATQLIFDGSYIVGLKASRTYAELARKNYEQAKIEAAAAVSKNYYSVLVLDERMKLINSNVDRIKKLRDDTRALYDNGFVEKVDLDRIEVNYNNIISEKQKVEKLQEITVAGLKYQLGMDINSNLTLTDKLEEINLNESALSDQVDYSKRMEYSIMQTSKRLYELDLKKNRFQYLPSVFAYGSFSYNASRTEFNIFDGGYKWYPTSLIGAKISVPIFDGLQRDARIRQSKLTLQKMDNDFKSLENGISLEAKSAKTNLLNALTTLQTQKKNRELAEEVARVSKIKYDQGVGSNLEVVNAESSLKEAEGNYFLALLDAYISKIDYEKATGTLLKN